MRHRKRRSRLSMKTARRNATMKNMAASLLKHQSICTILARAKEVRRLVEKLITLSKTDTVEARRRAYSVLGDHDMVSKLFKETSPLFKDRTSGFTRIVKLGFRLGDGAEMAMLELTEKKIVVKPPKKKGRKGHEAAEHSKAKAAGEKEAAEEPQKETREAHKEPKAKTIQKAKPTLEEEKRHEKAKSEDKKASQQRGFMKNLRGLFRKRGDF